MNFLQQVYRGKTDWWRWLVIISLFIFPFFENYLRKIFIFPFPSFFSKQKNADLVSNFFVFIPLFIGFIVAFQKLHRRSFLTVITARKKFDWLRFMFSFSIWGGITMLILVFSVYYQYEDYVWNFELVPFIELVVIAIVFVSIQTIFVDAKIKGYLLQALFYCFKKPLFSVIVVILISTFLTHLANDKLIGIIGLKIVIYFIIVNVFLVLVTFFDDGLEIALGVKVVNNLIFSVFTTSHINNLRTESVLINQTTSSVLVVMYFSMVLFPLYFLYLKKLYGWKNLKSKLLNTI